MRSEETVSGWMENCRRDGLDAAEVRLVYQRYRAYRAHHEKGGRGDPLPLERWFGWYRLEVASEAGTQAPSPSGCSIDDDSRNRGMIRKPDAFLDALKALAASAGAM
ncbi:MAG: hypothetical protein L6Q83_05325 [Gammaproteobacteria bacterium]|nr:hypothetical protein [Gammaproteobacteria bacterium]